VYGERRFSSARCNGLRIVGACGGRGTCGTCVVRVVEGQIDDIHSGPLDPFETRLAANTGDNATGSRIKWLRAC
jgi:ferredoxin